MAKREPSKRTRRDSGGPRQPNILVIWGDDIGYGTSAPIPMRPT